MTDVIKKLALALLVALFVGVAGSSGGTINAASCNLTDVNAVINGRKHKAVDGDVIQIPAGQCTWTSGVNVGGIGITIQGAGTANSSPTQMGAAASQTTIIDNRPTFSNTGLIGMSPKQGNSTARISMLNFTPSNTTGAVKYGPLIEISGSCNVGAGCPNARIDNITIAGTYGGITFKDGYVWLNDVFGVADHNTVGDLSHPGWIFINVGFGHYQGIGDYGDNSWAQPDTFGTSFAFYLENNVLNNFNGVDTGLFENGGSRYVCRFNQLNISSQALNTLVPGICAGHGTETGGRTIRGTRQEELYGNTINCNTAGCFNAFGFRSATARAFGNTYTGTHGVSYAADMQAQRTFRSTSEKGTGSFGMCDGTGPFDANDGVVYYSGAIASATAINGGTFPSTDFTIVPTGAPGWTSGQWLYSAAGAYSFHDVTGYASSEGVAGPWGTEIDANTTTSISSGWNSGNGRDIPHVGDTFQILRATVCLDQPGRGAGLLIKNGTPVLASTGKPGPANEVLDPIYFVDEHVLTPFIGNLSNNFMLTYSGDGSGVNGKFQRNRDFYTPTTGQTAQTSSTSPFNGTTGVGWGPLSLRPPTCTSGVAYLATDQGRWNTSGNSFGNGVLYICTSNTWPGSPSYVPYTYPHPLVTTSPVTAPPPPTNPAAVVD